jgi:hypothetical protein
MIQSIQVFLLCKRYGKLTSQPSIPLHPDQQQQDDEMDLEWLEWIRTDCIPYFGRVKMRPKYVTRLVTMLTKLVSDELDPSPNVLVWKPLQSTVSSLQVKSPEVTPIPTPDVEMVSLVLEPTSPIKERMVEPCMRILFDLCGSESDIHVSQICLPLVLSTCTKILERYVADRRRTNVPLPRHRTQEVCMWLESLSGLHLRAGEEIVVQGIHH